MPCKQLPFELPSHWYNEQVQPPAGGKRQGWTVSMRGWRMSDAERVLAHAGWSEQHCLCQASPQGMVLPDQVYGDPLEHPQTESYWGNVNCIGERSCYDEGKRAAECLTFDYQREHNLEVPDPPLLVYVDNARMCCMRPGRNLDDWLHCISRCIAATWDATLLGCCRSAAIGLLPQQQG